MILTAEAAAGAKAQKVQRLAAALPRQVHAVQFSFGPGTFETVAQALLPAPAPHSSGQFAQPGEVVLRRVDTRRGVLDTARR